MKRLLTLLIAVLILCTLACQPTPEADIVVNKGESVVDESMEIQSDDFSYPDFIETLPLTVEQTLDTANEAVTAQISAEVAFPQVEKIPVVEVVQASVDTDVMNQIIERLSETAY
ncbi:MAG: DUF6034 family protein, partial [Clostridia bacterium]|nr:DUF6034 family protein [Clostridia bacterium]